MAANLEVEMEKSLRRCSAAVLLTAAVALGTAAPAEAWLYTRLSHSSDAAMRVAEDPNKDIIAAIIEDLPDHQHEYLAMVKLDGKTGAEIWFREFPYLPILFRPTPAFAIDAAGDVAICSTLDGKFKVVKLDGDTGDTLWDTPISPVEYYLDRGKAVAIAANGDVIAGGNLSHLDAATDATDYLTVRLDGTTGAEIWRNELPHGGEHNALSALVLDSAGDVIECGGSDTPKVVKLSGATGAELWRREFGQPGFGLLAVDGNDDIVASSANSSPGLVKLSGATGATAWSQSDVFVRVSMALTPDDNVIVGGSDSSTGYLGVAKHSGTTGDPIWTQLIAGGRANAVSVEPTTGDVFAAGQLDQAGDERSFAVFRLASASGDVLWNRSLNGAAGIQNEAFAVAAKSDGKVIASGALDNAHTRRDAVVFQTNGNGRHTGQGKVFNFKIGEVFEKKWLWGISAELPSVAAPSPRGLGDLSSEGAQLELVNPSTRESAIIELPASNWTALGRTYASRGYRYLDPDHGDGPCQKVVFQPGHKLTVSCRALGRSHPTSLDEAMQVSFDVKLRLGGGDVYCFSTAGGEVKKDVGIGGQRQRGSFRAIHAPAPANCE